MGGHGEGLALAVISLSLLLVSCRVRPGLWLVATNIRVILVSVPPALQAEAKLAEALSRDPLAVKVSQAWAAEWSNVLALELRLSQGSQSDRGMPPDLLAIHLKVPIRTGPPAQDSLVTFDGGLLDDSGLVRVLGFPPGTMRAVSSRTALQRIRKRRVDDSWAAEELVASEVGTMPRVAHPTAAPQLRPALMPSVAFRRQWAGDADHRTRRSAMSVWRPVPPPGYVSVGDVFTIGNDEPNTPAVCLRADRIAEAGHGPRLPQLPPAVPPTDFLLAWRDGACPGQPVTLWEPVPPSGYVALGFVAVPQLEEPSRASVRCVRADLCYESQVVGSTPLWAGVSADSSRSGMAVWLVDNDSKTFVVSRPGRDGSVPKPSRVLGLLGAS